MMMLGFAEEVQITITFNKYIFFLLVLRDINERGRDVEGILY